MSVSVVGVKRMCVPFDLKKNHAHIQIPNDYMYMYKVYTIHKTSVLTLTEKMVLAQNFDKIGAILHLEKEVLVLSAPACHAHR